MADIVGSGVPFWTDDTAEWDTLILGGTVWPGIWEISGEGVQRKIDLKKSKGSDKATLKDEGYKNAKLTATGTIWTAEQLSELQAILPEVHPRKSGGDRTAMQLIHPAANLIGIDSVYLTGIKVPRLDGPKGGPLTVELSLIEWVPTPKPVKNASGGGGGQATCMQLGEYRQAAEWLQSALLNFGEVSAAAAASPDDQGLAAVAAAAEAQVAAARATLNAIRCPTPANQPQSDDADESLVDEALDGIADLGETVLDAIDGLTDWS
jgi:hypothetical protein